MNKRCGLLSPWRFWGFSFWCTSSHASNRENRRFSGTWGSRPSGKPLKSGRPARSGFLPEDFQPLQGSGRVHNHGAGGAREAASLFRRSLPSRFLRTSPPGPANGAPPGPRVRLHPLEDGYICTNHHVVAGVDTVTVSINDRSYKATIVGSDERTDLALLKVSSEPETEPGLPGRFGQRAGG